MCHNPHTRTNPQKKTDRQKDEQIGEAEGGGNDL